MKLRRQNLILSPGRILFLLWAFQSLSGSYSFAQENLAEADSALALVGKLDDPDPKVREHSEAALLKLGDKAIRALRDGIQNGSLESSHRCVILFEKIEKQRLRRIANIFLAEDADENELARFQAWNSFAEFAGSGDLATRKMFLNMCDQIPSAFEGYDIKGEKTTSAIKQLARLILVPNKHRNASSESLVLAYLFLVQQAEKLHADSNKGDELFSEVETLEAVSFFSTSPHAVVGKGSGNRKVIDRVVAQWLSATNPFESSVDPARFRLIFHTSNLDLIAKLEDEYESLDPNTKLKYIDIVSIAFGSKDKSALQQTWKLLQKPLADKTTVARSRVRRRPAEKIEVTMQLLAESKLAGMLQNSQESEEQIELESVFGMYPMSFKQFSIIKKQNDRQSLSRKVQARIAVSDRIK
jgi:hypothetical protein